MQLLKRPDMTRSRTRVTRKQVFYLYVFVLHLLIVGLVLKTDFIVRMKVKPDASPVNPHVSNMLMYHRWMDEFIPDGSIIFLGDSLTQGLATTAIAPNTVNYGIGSENTAQLLEAIPSYRSLMSAKAIFLNIGINDFVQNLGSDTKQRHERIFARMPPDVPLVWSGILPARDKRIPLAEIVSANQNIAALCSSRKNCRYVDTWQLFADKDGQPIDSMFLDDGTHLSHQGYAKWISALRLALPASAKALQR